MAKSTHRNGKTRDAKEWHAGRNCDREIERQHEINKMLLIFGKILAMNWMDERSAFDICYSVLFISFSKKRKNEKKIAI